MGDHRAGARRELPNRRSFWRGRLRWTFWSTPEPDSAYRTTWAVLRDRDGHHASACTWSDGGLTIEGVIGPENAPGGQRLEYSYRVDPGVVRRLVDGLGSPPWTDLVRVLAARGDQILDHGNRPLADVLEKNRETFDCEPVLNYGGPGSWLAARELRYAFGPIGGPYHDFYGDWWTQL